MKSLYYHKSIQSVRIPLVANPRSIWENKAQIKYSTGQTTVRRLTDKEINPETHDFKIHKVKSKEEFRPDLLAERYYGNPILYSVILAFNDLYSPLQVKQGMYVKIPDIFSVYGSDGIISSGGVY